MNPATGCFWGTALVVELLTYLPTWQAWVPSYGIRGYRWQRKILRVKRKDYHMHQDQPSSASSAFPGGQADNILVYSS